MLVYIYIDRNMTFPYPIVTLRYHNYIIIYFKFWQSMEPMFFLFIHDIIKRIKVLRHLNDYYLTISIYHLCQQKITSF